MSETHPGSESDNRWRILFDAARFSEGAGEYERAELRFGEALAEAERAGAGDEARAEILGELFEMRRNTDPAGAWEIGEQRLALVERLRGADHEELGTLLTALGCVAATTGEIKRGRELFRRGRRILEEAVGVRHPDVGRALLGMAIVLRDAGREEDAEPFYRRALDILETAFGPDHLEVAEALEGVALCCDALGEPDKAERFYRRALSAYEHTLGANSPPVAEVASRRAASRPPVTDTARPSASSSSRPRCFVVR